MMFGRKVIYKGRSQHGSYMVIDTVYGGRPARVLYGDNGSAQSGVARDDNPELLFDYNQRFFEMIMSKRPRKLLVIGGGAFMLPIAAFHRFPDMVIDVVEVDELLVEISQKFFELPDDTRLSVHVEDGAKFISNIKEKYDMIIIDAFIAYNTPPHLFNSEILRHYARTLTTSGIVAVNFISEYKSLRPHLADELLDAFGTVFPCISLYQADPEYAQGEEQNHLLVAGMKPAHFDYLQSNELTLH